jgi:N-acetylmuramoyl-L-alanine amidase
MKNHITAIVTAIIILIAHGAAAQTGTADEYDSGKGCYRELLRQGGKAPADEWRRCIAFFDGYYERNPKSGKASAALFSAGKLKQEHYRLRRDRSDLDGSVKSFNELIRNFPTSSLADDALYRIGCMRQDAFDQPERARKAFSHILEKYPSGDMAVNAKARLAKLGPEKAVAAPTAETAPAESVAVAEADVETEAPESAPAEPTTEEAAATKSNDDIEESDLVAADADSDKTEYVRSGEAADAFNRATLLGVDVKEASGTTAVDLVIDRDVEHSVEFTELGLRTGSPPELEVILLHTKAAKDLRRERLLESNCIDSYKVKGLILSSGIKVTFKLRPEIGYKVKRSGRGLKVTFSPTSVATAVPSAEGAAGKASESSDYTIVIDPGHGGDEDGAIGPGGTKEKDVTLAIAKRLANELRSKLGARVYLTRTRDTTMTLEQRNQVAVRKKADLFISIHANASRDRSISGIETYFLNNASDEAAARLAARENRNAGKKLTEVEHILSTMLQNYDAAESMELAKNVHGRLAKKVTRKHGRIKDRGVRSALFYVLVGAKCPAILVETAFISNPKEEKLLKNRKYQRNVADAIADGVKGYLKVRDKALVSL